MSCWTTILICLLHLPPQPVTLGETLQNVVTLPGGTILNGSAPHTAGDFAALRERGVRTIVAVDGARPNVTLARQYGMRYVHLPVSYDTISFERQRSFARVVRHLPKPVYFHCLHGQHRSPAVVATTMTRLGHWTPTQGLELLKRMKTSERYTGLYQVVRDAEPFAAELLEDGETWVAIAETSDIVQQMVQLDQTMSRLQIMADNHWATTDTHPDLDLKHLLLQMRDQLGAVKSPACDAPPQAASPALILCFTDPLAMSRAATDEMLRGVEESDARLLRFGWIGLQRGCKSCHNAYRN